MTIGRLAPATLVIDSPVISKMHARIRRTGDQIVVEDLHSSNGTFVNGVAVKQTTPLRDDDLISVGGVRAYRVRFTAVAETPALDPTVRMESRKDDPPAALPVEAAPAEPAAEAFAQDWKTKFAWSPEDLAVLEAERAKVIEEVKRVAGLLPDADGTDRPAPTPAAPPTPVAAPVAPPAAPPPHPAAAHAAEPAGPITSFGHAGPVTSIPHGLLDDDGPEPPKPVAAPPPARAPKRAEDTPHRTVPAGPRVAAPEAPTEAHAQEQVEVPYFVPETISVRSAILKGKPGEFMLQIGTHVIGRQEDCEVHVNDRQISRRHASISVSAAAVTVDDLGSANGTKVNGEPVTRRRDLADGDTLTLGEVEFKVELP
jgi:pSer/pThr/pTyr-binding forkhead associated (FHA) protein